MQILLYLIRYLAVANAAMLIVYIIRWAVRSYGQMYVFKRLGAKYPICAWIPFVSWSVLAYLMRDDKNKIKIFSFDLPYMVVMLWPVYAFILLIFAPYGLIFYFVCSIIFCGSIYCELFDRFGGIRSFSERTSKMIAYISSVVDVLYIAMIMDYRLRNVRLKDETVNPSFPFAKKVSEDDEAASNDNKNADTSFQFSNNKDSDVPQNDTEDNKQKKSKSFSLFTKKLGTKSKTTSATFGRKEKDVVEMDGGGMQEGGTWFINEEGNIEYKK